MLVELFEDLAATVAGRMKVHDTSDESCSARRRAAPHTRDGAAIVVQRKGEAPHKRAICKRERKVDGLSHVAARHHAAVVGGMDCLEHSLLPEDQKMMTSRRALIGRGFGVESELAKAANGRDLSSARGSLAWLARDMVEF